MENKELRGITLYDNLKAKRMETKKHSNEIDIREYLDKPIEELILDSQEIELIDDLNREQIQFCEEEASKDNFDAEMQELSEAKQYKFNLKELEQEECLIDLENKEDEKDEYLVKVLEEKIKQIEERLQEKEEQISYLKEENFEQKLIISDFHQSLTREQEIVMREQDLREKTLSKVEILLLEKREELIERQHKKRNWFSRIFSKKKS